MNSYCLRCKRTTRKLRVRRTVSRNGRLMLSGILCECGTNDVRFVQKGGDTVDSLNALTRRVKLPWFIRIFKNKFTYISVTDEASDFKFGKPLGFTKTHHKIPRRRKVGMVLGYESSPEFWSPL